MRGDVGASSAIGLIARDTCALFTRTNAMIRPSHAVVAVLLGGALLPGGRAEASPRCRAVAGVLISSLLTGPECRSPLGLCTRGWMIGGITQPFTFTLLALSPTEDTGSTGVMHYTGEMVIETRDGRIVVSESGAFDADASGTGDVAAVSTIVAGGSGRLRFHGTFTPAAGGHSAYSGQVCGVP
jgi:hypothetical protein